MTHIYERVAELAFKHLTGDISEEEIIELNDLRLQSGLDSATFNELLDPQRLAADLILIHKFEKNTSWEKIETAHPFPTEERSAWRYVKWAAVIIPLLCGLAWLWLKKEVVAPKDHLITFNESDLQTIVRQLHGDPELEVVYYGDIPPVAYTGVIPSSTPPEEFVHDLLSAYGYTPTYKGKKIIVHI